MRNEYEDDLNRPIRVITRDQVAQQLEKVEVDSLSPWIAIEDLPSKLKAYPEKARIWYKSFSYGELEKWTNTTLSEEDKINLGLQGIKTEGFDKSELDLQDFYYLMLLRKLSTFNSPRFQLKFECPHCGEISHSNPELIDIHFEELKYFDKLPVTIELSNGDRLTFSPVTLADYIRFKKSGEVDNRINRLALQIRNKEFNEAVEYIKNIENIDDMEILDELDVQLNFGNQDIEVKCIECEGKVTVPIQGVSALAEPFRQSKRSLKDSIVSS